MTVAELRARLAGTPPEFDDAEILVIDRAERIVLAGDAAEVFSEDPERVERYLILRLARFEP